MTSIDPRWNRLILPAWCTLLVATIWGLRLAGRAGLGTPAPRRWPEWIGEEGVALALVATIRLGAMVATWYFAVVTAIGVLARRTRSRRLPVVDRATPSFLRTVLDGARSAAPVAGLGLALLPVALPARSGSVPAPTGSPGGTATLSVVAPTARPNPPVPPRPRPVAEPVGGTSAPEPAPVGPQPLPREPPSRPPERSVMGQVIVPDPTWTVAPGDHFWAIASEVLADHLGRTPDDHEVTRFWRSLITVNRALLVDPDNPDLLYPGQVLVLPDPGAEHPGRPPEPAEGQPGT